MCTTNIYLQAGLNDVIMQMWPLFLIIVVFYFMMWRPQAKKQKEQQSFLSNLEKGQEVVTASGMLGKINKIEEDIVTLEVGTKTFIRVTRSAISKEMTEALQVQEQK